ncbi:MAG: ABC transporter permease [Burkholderiales bacterium]
MFTAFGFERRVATRFLAEGRMQTLLIIVGVAAGVAVVAYISALIAGLQKNTIEKTLGAQAQVTLSERDAAVVPARAPSPGTVVLASTQPRVQKPRSIANWEAVVPLLEALPGVLVVSPTLTGAGLALRGEASKAIALIGVDLDRYDQIVGLRSKVIAGQARLGPGEGVIGRELALDLGVAVGDRIGLATGSGESATTDSLRITAVVDFGLRELNRRSVVVPLRTAQNLIGLPGGATSLELTLEDLWSAQTVAAELAQRLPYKVESWQDANAQLVSALRAQSISTGVIRGVVMVVVVLGIASVLVVSVVQKRREIGILRAMGATQGQVLRVFLLQGGIVGAIGSVLGLLLSVGLIWAFSRLAMGDDGLPLFKITLELPLALEVAGVATVCGVLAAVAPARNAARLDPAQAIRM